MKLLLDESLPRRLREDFDPHDVTTVPDQGWAGLRNGELLDRASRQFDVFVTGDQNLPHQQNLSRYEIRVLVLAGRSNTLADLRPLVAAALEVLPTIEPGTARVVVG